MKSTKKFTITSSSHHSNGRKYDCHKRFQNFLFYFDWPKNAAEILKYKTDFIIKSNESSAENKTKKTKLNSYA